MYQENQKSINISAPNLISICVNGMEKGEIQGAFYHYYSEEPVCFYNIVDLIRSMEDLFDELVFPQASTKSRSLFDNKTGRMFQSGKRTKKVAWEELFSHTGTKGTFITCVKFRQRATWQGDFYWKEQEQKFFFSNELEFIRQLVQALEQA